VLPTHVLSVLAKILRVGLRCPRFLSTMGSLVTRRSVCAAAFDLLHAAAQCSPGQHSDRQPSTMLTSKNGS
jgi:hypothetical protein